MEKLWSHCCWLQIDVSLQLWRNQNKQDPLAISRVNSHSRQWALYLQKGAGGQSASYTGQVGSVERLKTIAGPCESLCGEACVADLHVNNRGASHTHYTRLWPSQRNGYTHMCTHIHTHTQTTNKRRGRGRREGVKAHCKKTARRTKDFISWGFGNITWWCPS